MIHLLFHLPSLMNKLHDTGTHNRVKDSSPTQKGHYTSFWLRTMVSDLEEQTIIPAASHSLVNRRTAHLRSGTENANRSMSSEKLRWEPEVPKPDRPFSTTAPWDAAHEHHSQYIPRCIVSIHNVISGSFPAFLCRVVEELVSIASSHCARCGVHAG